MKPHQKTNRLRRQLAVQIYKQCGTPEKFERILLGVPDLSKRRQIYHVWKPMLPFRPRPLEEINGSQTQ